MDNKIAEIERKMAQVGMYMHRSRMRALNLCGRYSDTTRGQGRVLSLLKREKEISTRDLAYLLGIRQQSLNEQLLKLERENLVERKPLPEDKRVMIVHLTPAGEKVDQSNADWDSAFSCLNEEELNSLSACLDKILDANRQIPEDCYPGRPGGRGQGRGQGRGIRRRDGSCRFAPGRGRRRW